MLTRVRRKTFSAIYLPAAVDEAMRDPEEKTKKASTTQEDLGLLDN